MPSTKTKIVYSLRLHIALQQQGFAHITEMKNPQNPHLNCWVYEATPRFIACFEALMREAAAND